MALKQVKQSLHRLHDALLKRSYFADKDEKGIRARAYNAQIETHLRGLEDQLWTSVGEIETKERRLELFLLYDSLKKADDIRTMLLILSRMDELIGDVKEKEIREKKRPINVIELPYRTGNGFLPNPIDFPGAFPFLLE